MRINATHSHDDRGLDAYWTPYEAVNALIEIEDLPKVIWEPACGEGNIVTCLQAAGHDVHYSDVKDYGLPHTAIVDFVKDTHFKYHTAEGIVTNPPFKLAQEFVERSLKEVDYVAMYLRLNWLEAICRKSFFENSGLSRVWISSRRLPMMHRYGWEGGKISSSNMAFAWYIWDHRNKTVVKRGHPQIRWFDWKDYV